MQTLQQLRSGELAGATKIKLSCGLTEFPTEILELADTLEYLDLSGNKLSTLPAEFSQLKKLKIAFFSDNLFTELPEVLGTLPQLEMLGFKANKIVTVPENSLAKNLRWLILTNNQIIELPKSIGNCTSMQKLMLAGNKLRNLPSEMAACRNLELLRIPANEIAELPGWLFELPRLSWLAFAGNPCSKNEISTENLTEIPWPVLALKEQLGEGASGEIYKAHFQNEASNLSKNVAVKIFKGEVTSDGLPADEMQATISAGTHSNLVNVLGKLSQHPQGKQGLVLELIPPAFRNLGNPPSFETCTRDTYPEGTAFPWKAVLNIAGGIASAAAHLHKKGIMHGDLYAHNMLTNKNAHVLFGDFGAATIYNRNSSIADKLEKLEVRAFGYLLEDLLERLNFTENTEADLDVLIALKQACLQENITLRPDFETITARISKLQISVSNNANAPISKFNK
ncbi:leucine-rich repeat-containing protein kinase family protein [Adhaeribacter terreus]|uniref:Leucine-rich repeat-containing protein kinase family protein n=1 Tax=Adhaeribacter terreus TaxID=529703 RepID=A0ABW0EF83_9BACT